MSQVLPDPDSEVSWKELIFGRNNTLWFVTVAVGFLLFELTAQPAMVAVAVCSKFGISELLNAFWLRRTDPLRVRGKVGFWFCLSLGLWKTTIVAFVAMFMFIVLAKVLNVAGPPAGFIGTAMTFLLAFVMASLTTFIGSLLARIGGLVIWIDGELANSRRSKQFPPIEGNSNRVHWLLAGAMILPIVVFLFVTLLIAGAKPAAIQNAIGLLIGLFLLPLGIFAGGIMLFRTVVASDYDECWTVKNQRKGMTLVELAIQEGVVPPPDEQPSGPELST